MQKKYIFGILFVVLSMFFLRRYTMTSIPKNEPDTNSTLEAQVKVTSPQETSANESGQVVKSENKKPESTATIATSFTEQIRIMNKCFDYQFNLGGPVVEPTADNVINMLRPYVGEGVIKMEDWTQQDFKNADGSTIRIRTEMEYDDESNPVRRVQLYKLNAQGMPIMQTIDPHQAVNPTDTYLATLQGDAKPVEFESGNRIYYQDGEELVYVEQNGQLNSFSFSKGERTVSCSMISSGRTNCQCM